MARRTLLAGVLIAALSVAACQSPPPEPSVAAEPASEATEALAQGDYAGAAEMYRRALAANPDRLPLRYGLAVAASHLGRRDESAQAFAWVLRNAPAGSPEAEAARRWLVAAGMLPSTMSRAAEPVAEEPLQPGSASLEGMAAVTNEGRTRPARRIALLLIGQPGSPAAREQFRIRADEEGRFRFSGVPPGTYMLTDAVAGPAGWRLRVEIGADQVVVLDLTQANSANFRNDFPDYN